MTWFGWVGLVAFIVLGTFALLAAALPRYGSINDPHPHDALQLAAMAAVGLGVMIWGAVA